MGDVFNPTPITTTVKRAENSTATHSTTTYATSKTQDTVRHTLVDDGVGGFGPLGTINYAGKTLTVRLVSLDSTTKGYKSDFEDASAFEESISGTSGGTSGSSGSKGADYTDAAIGEEVLAASTVTVSYAESLVGAAAHSMTFRPPTVTIDLCPYTADYIVPGSVQFTWMGHVFIDVDGVLYRDRTGAGAGFVAGQLDYSSGIAEIYDYVVAGSPTDFTLDSLWTVRRNWTTASIFMRTQAAPLKPGGFVMNLSDAQGNAITATGDLTGNITGTHLRGKLDYESGVVELQFGDYVLDATLTDADKAEWWYDADDVGAVQADKIWRPWPVDPTTLRYNTVAFFYLPLDAELLGLDPVRLPQDGRVPIYQTGGRVFVGHTRTGTPITVSNGQTIDLARTRLSLVRVTGADGNVIVSGYSVDLKLGLVTFHDVTGYAQPVTIEDRIADMVLVSDVGIDGTLKFNRQLTHNYPVPGSYVSSALMAGDLRARVSIPFDQQTWANVWADVQNGDAATGTYNAGLAPIEVTNAGASTERWALVFTSSTAFQVIGENFGVIGTGNINSDTAPVNPATGEPYFTLRELGWGLGWAPGNVLRFNTIGALFSPWVVQTTQPGIEAEGDYTFELLACGDVDRP